MARQESGSQTNPAELHRLHSNKIKQTVDDILYAYLYRVTFYDPSKCGQMCRKLCKLIRDRAEEISSSSDWPEVGRVAPHKFVINVFIGQDTEQDFQLAFRTLTDPSIDGSITSIYRNKAVFAVAIVHGIQSRPQKKIWEVILRFVLLCHFLNSKTTKSEWLIAEVQLESTCLIIR